MKILSFKFLFVIIFISQIGWLFFSCSDNKAKEGEKLAKTYCGSCHLQPNPSDLPRNVWEISTLPYMGMMMGLDQEIEHLPAILKSYTILKSPEPLISQEDYDKIKAYYLSEAPEKIDESAQLNPEKLNGLFTFEEVQFPDKNPTIPNFTCIKFDKKNKQIIAGDQSNRIIWFVSPDKKMIKKWENKDALTHVEFTPNRNLFTYIGSTTQANPNTEGYIEEIKQNFSSSILINKVKRPLETIEINLDQEPEKELLTCEFGFDQGGLSIWKKTKNGYSKKILDPQTGATQVKIHDFNGDGKLDILALFAQGNERITLFINQGNLNFEPRNILRFSPIWGTSSFELTDLNGDNQLDIITTAGDNADFSTVLKPFHGLRIYLNKGNFTFNEPVFFPQNGSTKVMAGDFDLDGDSDLVSISLFPNVQQKPLEQILYLENQKGKFIAKGISANNLGRFAVMDCGDIDQDGDLDILLGSHAVAKFAEGQFNPQWKNAQGIVILRNQTKN